MVTDLHSSSMLRVQPNICMQLTGTVYFSWYFTCLDQDRVYHSAYYPQIYVFKSIIGECFYQILWWFVTLEAYWTCFTAVEKIYWLTALKIFRPKFSDGPVIFNSLVGSLKIKGGWETAYKLQWVTVKSHFPICSHQFQLNLWQKHKMQEGNT